MEGALFGAAALRMIGFPPLLLDLEATRDDDKKVAERAAVALRKLTPKGTATGAKAEEESEAAPKAKRKKKAE